MKYTIFALFLLLATGCAGLKHKFKPFKEAAYVCEDVVEHTGCRKIDGNYDNLELHTHDPREIEDLIVPFK